MSDIGINFPGGVALTSGGDIIVSDLHNNVVLEAPQALLASPYFNGSSSDPAPAIDTTAQNYQESFGNSNIASGSGNSWVGGDGNYSIKLANGEIIWLYSDSYLGQVNSSNQDQNWSMPCNQVVVQPSANSPIRYNVWDNGVGNAYFSAGTYNSLHGNLCPSITNSDKTIRNHLETPILQVAVETAG